MPIVTKCTSEFLNKIAEDKDLVVLNTYNEKDSSGKSRKYISFLCNKHLDKGEQRIVVDKFDKTKKPCKYCNHSFLHKTFKDEVYI